MSLAFSATQYAMSGWQLQRWISSQDPSTWNACRPVSVRPPNVTSEHLSFALGLLKLRSQGRFHIAEVVRAGKERKEEAGACVEDLICVERS